MPPSSVFTKAVKEITFSDVVEFCNARHHEGAHLDYKLDLSKDVDKFAKTVSAIANSLGGTIILGIEDENDQPVLPVRGRRFPPNVRNSIEEAIYAHIQPPVFVEISDALPNPDDPNLKVIDIRVPQSLLAPHVMHKEKSIYVRTGQAGRPEDLISPEQLPWLYDLRKKSTVLKDNLIEASGDRFRRFRGRTLREAFLDRSEESIKFTIQDIWMVPMFPYRPLLGEVNELHSLALRIRGNGGLPKYLESRRSVPHGLLYTKRFSAPSGHPHQWDMKTLRVTELNVYGLFADHQTLSGYQGLVLTKIVKDVCAVLTAGTRLLNELGYWGPVELGLRVSGLDGAELLEHKKPSSTLGTNSLIDSRDPILLDDQIEIIQNVQIAAINENPLREAVEFAYNVCWSFGLDWVSKDDLTRGMDDHSILELPYPPISEWLTLPGIVDH